MDPAQTLVLIRFASLLEELGVTYAVGGSIASGYWGEPRSTFDIDVLADLRPEHAASFVVGLRDDFFVDAVDIQNSLERSASFQLVHHGPIAKVDVFLPRDRPLDRAQLDRRVQQPVGDGDPRMIWVTSAEVIVLRKLDWYRIGNNTSDRQWRDVLGVLKMQRKELDLVAMTRIAEQAGLLELLRRALLDAGFDRAS